MARAAHMHDTLTVGTPADGEATVHGPETNEPPLFEIASVALTNTARSVDRLGLKFTESLSSPEAT